MARRASLISAGFLVLAVGIPSGLVSQSPRAGRQPASVLAQLSTPISPQPETVLAPGAPHPLQIDAARRRRPSFLGAAVAASLGATAGALLGVSTQSQRAVGAGAWLGGAVAVSIVTNDPTASVIGSAGGIAAVLLVADPTNELQIVVTYASVTSLLARAAMP
jgi:hypothetical protein